MALLHSFESSGNFLFKYRGQIPIVLFLAAIPVVFFTDYSVFNYDSRMWLTAFAIVVSILGFWVRFYTIGTTPKGTSGRNTQEQVAEVLNSTGIYSMVRHPLYLGNYLIWIGIVLYTFNFWFFLCVSLAYWLYYERIMFAEERFLERKFGPAYMDWSMTAPAFVPAFGQFRKSEVSFSLKAVLRREYSGFLATVIGFIFIDVLREYFSTGDLYMDDLHLWILVISVIITLVLRTLKRGTKVLNEEDRS